MTEKSICPCEGFTHPVTISNLPGQDTLSYRVGDFASFRQALLMSLQDDQGNSIEAELTHANWSPTKGDLALQMVEWWAYLADILTFYNERIANEAYLRTADLPESVQRLIRLLGYRPRPGIGAQGSVAALLTNAVPLTLPQGFQIQSKPGPGKQPQIFELDSKTSVKFPDVVEADLPPSKQLLSGKSILLKGTITTVKAGDRLLLLEKGWNASTSNYALATVQQVEPEKDPRGKPNTRITFVNPPDLPSSALATSYRLLQSKQVTHLWQYPATTVITADQAHLESLTRTIAIGDPVLFEIPSDKISLMEVVNLLVSLLTSATALQLLEPPATVDNITTSLAFLTSYYSYFQSLRYSNPPVHNDLMIQQLESQILQAVVTQFPFLSNLLEECVASKLVSVTSYTEVLWYANPDDASKPYEQPVSTIANPKIAIPILHTLLKLKSTSEKFSLSQLNSEKDVVQIHYDFQEVGELIGTPAATAIGTSTAKPDELQLTLLAVDPNKFPSGTNQSILLEDAKGQGIAAQGDVAVDQKSIQLTITASPPALSALTPPLRVLFNPLPVSRGQTVTSEILGSGDASLAGQEFVLKKSPLTYLLSGTSTSGRNYTSTLRVWVNGVEWQEMPSFYEQSATARIFVTREDANQCTHVQFGDGINGARLPSGINNVTARYRYGCGAEALAAGSLNVILKPYPGLKAIRNPVAVGGGSDPDPAEQIRRYAPQSVLTFERAVSGDDYETIAAQTPGVTRAKAYWTWDTEHQCTLVKIYVGDDDSAVKSAQVALAGAVDPNRPVKVKKATAIPLQLVLTLKLDSAYLPDPVLAVVREALLNAKTGLLGTAAIRVGRAIYRSQIYRTCCLVPGVLAVTKLQFWTDKGSGFNLETSYRYDPGEGGFYQLSADDLKLAWEVG